MTVLLTEAASPLGRALAAQLGPDVRLTDRPGAADDSMIALLGALQGTDWQLAQAQRAQQISHILTGDRIEVEYYWKAIAARRVDSTT